METDFVLLTEKEEMLAKMLLKVLEDNHIPCAALPVHGAGVVIKTGMQEQMSVFVARESKDMAEDLMKVLFGGTA